MENISFEYPAWYILICLLIGAAISGILYYRDIRFRELRIWARYLLASLRFAVASLLAMLLLSPLLKSTLNETKDPQIVVLEDRSTSIFAGTAEEKLSQFNAKFGELVNSLSSENQIEHFYFGDEVIRRGDSVPENYKVSNIAEGLEYVHDLYNDQNLGAIILVSDGLYNEGRNPIYQNLQFKAPLYTIGMGDTTVQRDLLIKNIFYNKIAYLGDQLAVQVDIQAVNSSNSRSQLTVFEERGSEFVNIQMHPFNILENSHFQTIPVTLDASRAGLMRYRFQLDGIANEMTGSNNYQDIYIEVLDSKMEIVILANAPHPDISALKKVIDKNNNYELSIHYPDDPEMDIEEPDFVIFHNLPSRRHSIESIIRRMETQKTPRMYFVGAQTNLSSFNEVQNTIEISGNNTQSNEVQAVINERFNLFNVNDETRSSIGRFVPLLAPFGEYSMGPGSYILYYQKIGNVATPYPLISFSEQEGIKTAIVSAEGMWKWQLYDFLQHDNTEIFEDLVGRTITYTTVKEDKRKFRVSTQKNLFKENESIVFSAELYNNSYQLVNDPDVHLTVTNNQGEDFDFVFSKRNRIYELNAGLFPEGNYSYDAHVQYQGNPNSQSGRFSVQSIQLEMFNLQADHQLLDLLSEKYGGKFAEMDKLDSLSNWLENASQLRPLVFSSTHTRSVIHIKWIFALMFLLLTAEWFFRRYFGSY